MAFSAHALPTGPTATNPTVGPTAPTFAKPASTQLSVTLNNARTIIDWTTFGIANGETLDFLFPTKSSIVLNRIPAGSATIAGTLNGCVVTCSTFGGNIWIYAPNGVIFGNGAVVNTGGLLATSSPMLTTDADFVAGGENPANQFKFGTANLGSLVDIQSGAAINGTAARWPSSRRRS